MLFLLVSLQKYRSTGLKTENAKLLSYINIFRYENIFKFKLTIYFKT